MTKLTRREDRFGKDGNGSPPLTALNPKALARKATQPSPSVTSTSRKRIRRAIDATTTCDGRSDSEASAAMDFDRRVMAQSNSSSMMLHARPLSIPTLQPMRNTGMAISTLMSVASGPKAR